MTDLKSAFAEAVEKRAAELDELAEEAIDDIATDLAAGDLVPWANELGQWLIDIADYLPPDDFSNNKADQDSIIAVMRGKTELEIVDFGDDRICMRSADPLIPSEHEDPKNLYYYCASCGVWGASHSASGAHLADHGACESPQVKAITLADDDVAKIDAASGDINFLDLVGRGEPRRVKSPD